MTKREFLIKELVFIISITIGFLIGYNTNRTPKTIHYTFGEDTSVTITRDTDEMYESYTTYCGMYSKPKSEWYKNLLTPDIMEQQICDAYEEDIIDIFEKNYLITLLRKEWMQVSVFTNIREILDYFYM